MDIALWIVAGLLAAVFAFAGLTKAVTPKEKLTANMAWVEDFSPPVVKLIGIVEVLGAIGLTLPALVNIAPVLVPVAATGLAITMALAIGTHVRRKEPQVIPANVVLLVAAAFVAWGRFGPYAF